MVDSSILFLKPEILKNDAVLFLRLIRYGIIDGDKNFFFITAAAAISVLQSPRFEGQNHRKLPCRRMTFCFGAN